MKKREKAFTLVELLVVISIIAILSVIGLTIYGKVQVKSRDSRRRADINSIAEVMEVNYGKDTTAPGTYKALAASMFSSGKIPKDPIDTFSLDGISTCPSNCRYCVREGNSEQTTAACPGSILNREVSENSPIGGTANPYWSVCANLEETAGTYYCRKNIQ